jgi:hypothetical protein
MPTDSLVKEVLLNHSLVRKVKKGVANGNRIDRISSNNWNTLVESNKSRHNKHLKGQKTWFF